MLSLTLILSKIFSRFMASRPIVNGEQLPVMFLV